MITVENICISLSCMFFLALMTVIAKVIYRERCFESRKAWMIYGGLFLVASVLVFLIPGDLGTVLKALILVAAFGLMITITRKKRRVRGFFLFLPVIGMVMSLEMIPQMLWMIFTGNTNGNTSDTMLVVEVAYEMLLLAAFFVFRKKLHKNITSNELGIWERRILNGNGMLLMLIYIVAVSIPKTLSKYDHYLLAGGILIAVMICGSTIGMIIKSISADYYKSTAEINEYYLNMQLNHFKAYQETQRETRRIRHDMKNHMICAYDLYQREEKEKLGEYLSELSNLTRNIDKEFHIGNDMADAIINEKYAVMKVKGIELEIEGSMAGIDTIAPIDICTMFANALDNAIDAMSVEELDNPRVEINIKKNKRLLLISFINPCNISLPEKTSFETTKKDRINHGFGLENIKRAAEKYKGGIECRISENESIAKLFSLDIMLFI